MTTHENKVQQRAEEEDTDLIDLLIVLAKHRRLVIGLPVVAVLLAVVVSFLIPPTYTGTARILPPQQSQPLASAVLGQLGSLSGVAASSLGLKNPGDLYVGMLKSRTIADSLIDQFKLQELLAKKTIDDTRLALADITKIKLDKDGIISIAVDDKDPRRAADMANAYVEHLDKLNERLAVTEASQRRLFFEKQLRQQKDSLASAEVDLRKVQEQTGLIKMDDQGRAIIEAVAQVRAQIAAKEVQISSLRSFTTERNAERIRAEAELQGLRQQLLKLESKTGNALEGGTFVPTGRVPEAGLEYVRRLREVKYHETLFELLAKQYELARLDESKDASIIQVLDRAVAPEKRTSPKRRIIVLATAAAAGILAILLAFAKEAYDRLQSDSSRAERWRLLRSYLKLGLHR